MEPDFDELLNTTVVISTAGPASRTVYGVETYSGSGSTYQARYVEKRQEIRNGNGEVVVQSGVLWVDSTQNLSTKARVTITQIGRAFPVLAIERFPDEDGQHHVKLSLGHGARNA